MIFLVSDSLPTDQPQFNDISQLGILSECRIQPLQVHHWSTRLFHPCAMTVFHLRCFCVQVVLECLTSRGKRNGPPGRSRKVRSLSFSWCRSSTALVTFFPSLTARQEQRRRHDRLRQTGGEAEGEVRLVTCTLAAPCDRGHGVIGTLPAPAEVPSW